jgi:hypothetical protein
MAFVSPRMSLKIWNDGSDPYDSAQLADNYLKLDQHDHSDGRGVQIGPEGIQDGAILARHVYPGTLTSDVLDLSARIPLGTVLDWYCQDPTQWSTLLGASWTVCDGRTLTSAQHDIPGIVGSFTTPDLRNKFVLGANYSATVGSAGTPSVAPGMLGSSGSHTANLNHQHTVNGHSHTFMSPIGNNLGNPAAIHPEAAGTGGYNWNGSDQGVVGGVSSVIFGSAGTWAINGVETWRVTTDSTSTGTNTQLSSTTDIRPAYVGLLKIMKVK